MRIRRFEGCGDHGEAEWMGDGSTEFKYDPWCLKCNPLPAPDRHLTKGQRIARKTQPALVVDVTVS